jgi:hypothetical protein
MSEPEIFFQTLAILDHPADPMVIQFQLRFAAGAPWGARELQAATGRMFERHARLRTRLVVEERAFRFEAMPAGAAAELNAAAWPAMPLEEFRHQAIAFDRAPLARFRFDPSEGLSVAVHHSLMDGFGCFELCGELVRELAGPKAVAPVLAPPRKVRIPLLHRLWAGWLMVRDEWRKAREIARAPTSLLGPVAPPLEQRHHFLAESVGIEELRAVRARHGGRFSVNDLVLSAWHRALAGAIGPGARRLSVTVPFNMRLGGEPAFVNRTGYVSVSTLPEHRLSASATLERVHGEMARAKRFGTGKVVQRIMELYERLGLLRFARRKWLGSRLPARYEGPEKFFWRNFDTAIATNLGRLEVPAPYSAWVESVHGWAPVVSPAASLSVLGYGPRVGFGVRVGASVMDEAGARRLLAAFVAELRAS